VRRDLAFEIERYAELIEYFPGEDEPEEIIYALIYRDCVHDRLKQGEKLTPLLAQKLAEADARLKSMRSDLVRRFPGVFLTNRAPRDYWWWHLDEGPQVREQAEQVA
jgi:hypothetical protein